MTTSDTDQFQGDRARFQARDRGERAGDGVEARPVVEDTLEERLACALYAQLVSHDYLDSRGLLHEPPRWEPPPKSAGTNGDDDGDVPPDDDGSGPPYSRGMAMPVPEEGPEPEWVHAPVRVHSR